MGKTITVSVDEQIEKKFRKVAGVKYGRRKGYLGRALGNAMHIWLKTVESESVSLQAIKELKEGYVLGGIRYKIRGELHER